MFTSTETEKITAKINILDSMSTSIINLLKDKKYLQMYYPTDFAIRNKGSLTLITPHYASHLSALLKLSSDKIQLNNYTNETVIPDIEEVLNLIKNDAEEQDKDIIAKLVGISQKRVTKKCLAYSDSESLFWELTNRILNAKIGSLVKTYRSNNLTRINVVNFRSSIAVKSEKQH